MSYRARLKEFRYSGANDFPSLQQAVSKYLNNDVREQFILVEKETFQSQGAFTTAVQAVVPPPSGGAGTVINNTYLNLINMMPANTATVVAGSNIIPFTTPLATADYVVGSCYMISGTTLIDLLGEITSQSTSSFTVTCPEAGVLRYTVLPKGYTGFRQACTPGSNTITFDHAFRTNDYIVASIYAVIGTTLIDLRAEVTAQSTTGLTVNVPDTCTVVGACVPKG